MEWISTKKNFKNKVKMHVLDLLDKHTWELFHRRYSDKPYCSRLLVERFVKQLLEKPLVDITTDILEKKILSIPLMPIIYCFPKF